LPRVGGTDLESEMSGWGGFDDERWRGGFEPTEQPPAQTPARAPAPALPPSRRPVPTGVRYIPRGIGVVVFAIGLAVVLLQLIQLTGHEKVPAPAVVTTTTAAHAPVPRTYVFGDTAMPKPGTGKLWARQLCVAEIRASAAGGPWTCVSWMGYDVNEIPHAARDPGGPCTHRVVDFGDAAWRCETTLPATPLSLDIAARQTHPLFFADLSQPRSHGAVCTQEIRVSATHGAWDCALWTPVDANEHFRVVAPLDPGGPCTARKVDELTGVWTCQDPPPRPLAGS
jgi:hypothetical protein